jgi:NADH-quinone oxidoreductase subunit N
MDINYSVLTPEIFLALIGIMTLIMPHLFGRERKIRHEVGALIAFHICLILVLTGDNLASGSAFYGMISGDSFTDFARVLFLLTGLVITALSIPYLEQEGTYNEEFFSLLVFVTMVMGLVAASRDLLLTFIGIEILSIASYVMTAFRQKSERSVEAGLKYFIMGAFSSGFLLYGIAFLYGAAGSTRYAAVAEAVSAQGSSPLLLTGLALVGAGLAFKATFVPFHVWSPDVYEGAPLPVTAFLAVASKAAAILVLLRIVWECFPAVTEWQNVCWIAAVLTMLYGNIAALTQKNIKRMLAYSSIAHAGYLLVGIVAGRPSGFRSVLFYLFAYAVMNLGAFAVVQVLAGKGEASLKISDYSGLGFRYPFLSGTLALFLFSLAGIPFTIGFAGKFFLFAAAVEQQMYFLVLIGLVASAIGIYYYLKVIVAMYMKSSETGEEVSISVPLIVRVVVAILAVATVLFGILPGSVLKFAGEAVLF